MTQSRHRGGSITAVPESALASGRQETTDLGSFEDSTWSLLILNDDYTPTEFVVDAVEKFFDMDRESAMHLMLPVHNEGIAGCGTYSCTK